MARFLPLFLLLAAAPCACVAADAPPPAEAAVAASSELAERLFDEGLLRGRAYSWLEELLAVAPQRLSGSLGYALAAQWAENTMRELGLSQVRLEPVPAPHWERGAPERVTLQLAGGVEEALRACALGGSPAGTAAAEVAMFAGIQELEAAGESVRGKIVFLNGRMNPGARATFQAYGQTAAQRTRGPALAAKLGAVGVVVRSLSTAADDEPHTGATRFEDGGPKIPALALGVRSADRLEQALQAGPARLRLETHCRDLGLTEQWNVVGEIPGARSDEIVLLGAHLDAWDVGIGAHDDGAGCAQVLEAARLLRACGLRPARTIRFVLYANEENGLAGGRGYAAAHAAERHFVALESDSGGFTPRGIALDAPAAVRARLAPAAAALEPIGAARVRSGGGGADIGPLKEQGAVVGNLDVDDTRYFDLHHSRNDVLAAVHPRQLELGAVVLAYWAAWFADLEAAALAAE